MTPLALRIIRDRLRPEKERAFFDPLGIAGRIAGAACFELTEVQRQIDPLSRSLYQQRDRGAERLAFLPAPATWIEWADDGLLPDGNPLPEHLRPDCPERIAFLVERQPGADLARVVTVTLSRDGRIGSPATAVWIPLFGSGLTVEKLVVPTGWEGEPAVSPDMGLLVCACLALINTPRVIGRREHRPHAGLVRDLRRAGLPSDLMPWHEIVLQVRVPRENGDGDEAFFTGKKAQHFVRAHLRIRLGKLELVSSHWRGDPALGVKPAFYVVKGNRAA